MIGARWRATDAEVAAPQACDALAGEGAVHADRAISIAAPVDVVYRWLCQLRAAPYSYDLEHGGTRLAVRATFTLSRAVTRLLLIGDLVMMRKQLLTLKALAERT